AEALPVLTQKAENPLGTNLRAAAGEDVEEEEAAYELHEASVKAAYDQARAVAGGSAPQLRDRLPEALYWHAYEMTEAHLDWAFIFDWSKAFILRSYDIVEAHLARMEDAFREEKAWGWQPLLMRYFTRVRAKGRARIERVLLGGSVLPPHHRIYGEPRGLDRPFDEQAQAWMTMAQLQEGTPSTEQQAAFLEMLHEVERHYNKTDDGAATPTRPAEP
ncbi:MAG: hypothetical protein AAGP08_19445, partial [Pseudomonadota bacterium]